MSNPNENETLRYENEDVNPNLNLNLNDNDNVFRTEISRVHTVGWVGAWIIGNYVVLLWLVKNKDLCPQKRKMVNII